MQRYPTITERMWSWTNVRRAPHKNLSSHVTRVIDSFKSWPRSRLTSVSPRRVRPSGSPSRQPFSKSVWVVTTASTFVALCIQFLCASPPRNSLASAPRSPGAPPLKIRPVPGRSNHNSRHPSARPQSGAQEEQQGPPIPPHRPPPPLLRPVLVRRASPVPFLPSQRCSNRRKNRNIPPDVCGV